ncbi:hypothetical protein K5E_11280 [Enterococcus thailandicus]|uniref:coiled-coil domain-containing protein n=1 Tax=Enterococcus thailandicus TaxID=417368 RepID=UPI00244D80D7|nr:hypothetical protein [Enterococcus thailandicus]GMC02574.1 hypothetical protein K4E_00840 [Enterococcus thailandicus]GMC08989.1 hypothetical protein K5E_11280 [Enterococcus thailandicus]
MRNKKISKYVTLMAILTINTSPILNIAGVINSNVAVAETVGQAVTFSLNADGIETLMFWDGEDSKGLNSNQRYEITFEGSGQVEIYHNHNPYETSDLIKVTDGKVNGIVNRSFVEADSITIKANKGTSFKVIFTPVSDLDYTYLNELISDATELLKDNSDKYTADSWNKLSNAKYNAEFYLTTDYISHAELENIENTLKNAIDNLTTLVSVVNRKPLEEILNKVKALNETDYTPTTWKQLMTELKEAQKVYDDETSLSSDIETATNNLETMFKLLRKRADFTDLNKTIEQAKTYKEADYTVSTYAELERMLKDAEAVAKDLNSNQSEVDVATSNLKNAIEDLKKKGENGNDDGEETEDKVLVGNTITLKDKYVGYYAVYYDTDKDELSFKSSSFVGYEPPASLENISLNGEKTFVVNDEKWELVDNKNGTYNLKYLDNQVIRFNNLEEYADLVENYGLFHYVNNKVERITDTDLDFDAEYIDLNSEEGQVFNNNQVPILNFEFDDISFNFDFKFDEGNKLANHSFKYIYDLSDEFINSDVYKEFEGKEQYNGYIKRNILNAGGYQAYVMQYQLMDGKLIINVLNSASAEPLKTGRPVENFVGEGKIEVEIPIVPEKPIEKEELPVFKPIIRPTREKTVEIKQPKKVIKEEVPKMGTGPTFRGLPLIGVGFGGLALASVLFFRKKFPINTNSNEDKDIEE